MGTGLKIEIIPPEGSNAFAELAGKKVVIGKIHGVAIYPQGTEAGKTSVALFIEMPDGTYVHAETTAALWDGVNGAIKGSEIRQTTKGGMQ